MGELFRWEQPAKGLTWTGERFVNGIEGDGRIEIEHLHRYFVAREFCRKKSVLDVASGEGYGSSLLAQVASRVIGVDSDSSAVEHATRNYASSNLKYVQGSATDLPLESSSLDVVVSFETLEHFVEQEQFFSEVKRVLRPNGAFLISTPDVSVYSAGHAAPNPFHMCELTEMEFVSQLSSRFTQIRLLRQRAFIGSAIFPDASKTGSEPVMFERRSQGTYEASKHLLRAPYLVAFASNCVVDSVAGSVYVHSDELPGPDQAGHLQLLEEGLRGQMAAAHEASVQREAELTGAVTELRQQLAEARQLHQVALDEIEVVGEELKGVVLARQQQELVTRRLQRDLVQRTKSGLELEKLEAELTTSHRRVAQLNIELRKAEESLEQLKDFGKLEAELAASRLEIAELSKSYNEICNLVIPIWMRKSIPSSLKSPLRAIKRALRNG